MYLYELKTHMLDTLRHNLDTLTGDEMLHAVVAYDMLLKEISGSLFDDDEGVEDDD